MFKSALRLRRTVSPFALTMFFVAAGANSALAQSRPNQATPAPGQTIDLPSVDVVADWLGDISPDAIWKYPGGRTVVREQQMRDAGASTVAEALRLVPGVQVPPNNGTGGGDFSQNIGIRGMTSRLTANATVMMDGVPLSNAPYGQPETSLAPVSLGYLQAIDVVKNGSSVRYGPQNVGGIINYVTKPIPQEFGGYAQMTGFSGLGSATGFSNGKVDLGVGGTSQNGAVGAALFYSGNYGQGFREARDQQTINDLLFKYNVRLSDTSRIEGRAHWYDANAELPGPLNQADFNANPFQSTHSRERFEGNRKEVTAKYINEFDANKSFEVLTYYSNSFREFQLANNRDANATQLERLPRHYDVFGIEPRFAGKTKTGPLEHEWSFGYRFMYEDTNEMRYRRTFGAGGNPFASNVVELKNRDTNGTTRAHAVYADDKVSFGNFFVRPGIRLEKVYVNRVNNLVPFMDEEEYLEPLPALNAGWQIHPTTLLFAGYSKSFSAVTHLALRDTAPDTSLNPERAKTYEVGARFRNSGLSLEATLFHISFDDQIEAINGVNVNTGATKHRGVEIASEYDFGYAAQWMTGFSAYANYAYVRATREAGPFTGNELRLVSPHTATWGMKYKKDQWTFNFGGYAQSKQYGDEALSETPSADGKNGPIPGYALWNARVEYAMPRNVTLAFGVNNIFDQLYYTRASIENNGGVFVGAPRTAYIQARATF